MSQDIEPEEIDTSSTQGNEGDAKPPANTWPKIVAAVASALCTVSTTLFFTVKNQYKTEREDRLQLVENLKTERTAYEKEKKELQEKVDNCGSKTLQQIREQVEAVKDIKLTTISTVKEVVNDNKVTSDNIKNIRKATKELTQKLSKNE